MDDIGVIMPCDGRTKEAEEEQEDQECGAPDGGPVADKAVEDDASLAAPLLHQLWGQFKKRFNFFLRCDLFRYVHRRLLSEGMCLHLSPAIIRPLRVTYTRI